MDNGNIANVTLFKMPYTFKIWQIARKSNGLYFPQLHAFSKVCLKLDENCESS